MKILRLPAYFEPEQMASTHLWHDFSETVAKVGIETVVYTPVPSRGVSNEIRKEYKRKKTEHFYGGKLVVHRFSLIKEGKNPTLRALRYFLQSIKQFNRGAFSKDARECDAIFIVSTPPIQGAMASLLKKFRHIPLVYNLQDIFPDSLIGTGLASRSGLLWRIGRAIEDFTYHNADKIIVISEDFKRNIMAKGVPEEKIEVIYNWVDADAIQPVAKEDNPLFEEFGIDRTKFMVVYAGNLGNAQNIDIILEGAKMLPQVQFVVFGTGGLEDEIRVRIADEHLDNVRLLPLQPYERVSQVYSLGDVCVVSCKAGLGGSAMPSKTWSIMSCARPVLASFDEGELKQILESNHCGVFTHAGNVQEFADAIRRLSESPSLCDEMGKNARRFIEENLTKEVGTRRYVEVIKQFDRN